MKGNKEASRNRINSVDKSSEGTTDGLLRDKIEVENNLLQTQEDLTEIHPALAASIETTLPTTTEEDSEVVLAEDEVEEEEEDSLLDLEEIRQETSTGINEE